MARAALEGAHRPVRMVDLSRAVAGVAGAVLAAAGLALALFFAVAPIHITVQRSEPVQSAGGEFNLTLTPTGQTADVPIRATCLPIQGLVDPGQEADPSCLSKDARHNHIALAGLALFVVGGALWQLSGDERRLLGSKD